MREIQAANRQFKKILKKYSYGGNNDNTRRWHLRKRKVFTFNYIIIITERCLVLSPFLSMHIPFYTSKFMTVLRFKMFPKLFYINKSIFKNSKNCFTILSYIEKCLNRFNVFDYIERICKHTAFEMQFLSAIYRFQIEININDKIV